MARPLTDERSADIRKRAEYYCMKVNIAKQQNSRNDRSRKNSGFPSPNIYVSEEERYYAQDVPRLLAEIERLKVLIQELEDRA